MILLYNISINGNEGVLVMESPILFLVIPCYNEDDVLPLTLPRFDAVMCELIAQKTISPDSRILFVNDGSTDGTWKILSQWCAENELCEAISLSRNCGHQRALYAGIMEARGRCDCIVTADCDGQDDISVIGQMLGKYQDGADIVYGVRNARHTDSCAKRTSAHLFYRIMRMLGAETVYDHADFRLITARVADALAEFDETDLYLRGIIPLIGFESAYVTYERGKRLGGKSRYSFGRMLSLALDAVTGFSVRPLRIISALGCLVSLLSFIGIIWTLIQYFFGNTAWGWSSTLCILCFVSGVQLISLGVVGEYVGRIYTEVKRRPRYIVAKRTRDDKKRNDSVSH